jgi:uncharacterized protein (DUF983 family)
MTQSTPQAATPQAATPQDGAEQARAGHDGATRDTLLAVRRGALGRCPHCGQGRLFSRFLKVVPACACCGAPFHHHRADDLPAYAVIIIVGHIVVGGLVSSETHWEWPIWVHAALWPTLTVVLSLALIQPIKGAIVGLQWALRMHGFSTVADGDDHPALRPHSEANP